MSRAEAWGWRVGSVVTCVVLAVLVGRYGPAVESALWRHLEGGGKPQ